MASNEEHSHQGVIPATQIEKVLKIHPSEVSPWRIFKIMAEFVSGYEFLRNYKRAATFFGSARYGFDHKVYQDATKLAGSLAEEGFAIITGGGPGIMEAANHGAQQGGGKSVGLNIQLPFEQRTNKYVNESISFHYFFTRKVMLAAASQVYIFYPGGFGTLDELFEMLTLVQTDKIDPITIILVGKNFWDPMVDWIKKTMYAQDHAISEGDLKLFHVVDNADEALSLINTMIIHNKLNKSYGTRDIMKEETKEVDSEFRNPMPPPVV